MENEAFAEVIATNSRIQPVSEIGKGSFGVVCLAKDVVAKELVAVKVLKRSAINKYVEDEIINHSLLWHPHIVSFKQVFLTANYICIVQEYANGGSLFHYVQKHGRLPEDDVRWFFQQLVIGVDYCHKRGIANRDIKLENTLLHNEEGLARPLIKICDFGYSKSEHRSVAKSKVGTLTYMAPEVIVNHEDAYDGKAADVWSCGVILYVMLYGRYPFDAPPQQAPTARDIIILLDKMVRRQYIIPDAVPVSAACLDLLNRLLQPNPDKRLRIEAVIRHPWFLQDLPQEALTMNLSYLALQRFPRQQTQEEIYKTVQAAHGRTSHGGLLYTVPEEEVAATRTIQAEVAQYGHLNEFVRHKKSRVE